MTNTELAKYKEKEGSIIDGRFELVSFIDAGSSSVVYLAHDMEHENRPVALKILKNDKNGDGEDLGALRRMILESKAIFAINNPHVVKVYHISVDTPVKYIAMEFLSGVSLRSFCTNPDGSPRQLPEELALDITAQVLSALDAAHAQSIIHRDIKPHNIMLCDDGRVVVTDFGIAKLGDTVGATMVGKIVGTPWYISPEQAHGEVLCHRADLYSTGVTLYQMLCGIPPFDSDEGGQTGSLAILNMHIHKRPQPPRELNPAISEGAEQIILHSLKKRPSERFHSARHMREAIEQLRAEPNKVFPEDFDLSPVTAAQKRRALMTTVLVSLGAVTLAALIAAMCIVLSIGRIFGTPLEIPAAAAPITAPQISPELPVEQKPTEQQPKITLVTVPNVSGMSQSSATLTITAAGLTPVVVYDRGNAPLGFVILQAIPAGSSVREGTTVEIIVSIGMR